MSKRKIIVSVLVLGLIAFGVVFGLTGCGELSEEDVISKLTTNLEEATGYLSTGVMEVEAEGQLHTYVVEVLFEAPASYRVTLRNDSTGNEQIILKNDEGVFVLTPALNKQFKFQSEWPMTSSQVYLYQSLLQDLLNAEATNFEVTETEYVFVVGAAYHANGDLSDQVLRFDRKKLNPTLIEVRDANGAVRMSKQFDSFEWNPSIDEDAFVAEAIMEVAQMYLGEGAVPVVAVEDALLYPTYWPEGTTIADKTTLETGVGERVIMTFAGDHEFTLIQETARVREVMSPEFINGEPVLVNATIGAITDNSLAWQHGGVEFFLVSQTLDREQLVSVAGSVREAYEPK